MKNKDRIKELELQLSCLTALLAEYVIKEAIRKIPVPNYEKGCKENGFGIVNDSSNQIIQESKSDEIPNKEEIIDVIMGQQKKAKEQ